MFAIFMIVICETGIIVYTYWRKYLHAQKINLLTSYC